MNSQIESLNNSLSEIIQLKNDGEIDDAFQMAYSILEQQFQLPKEELENNDIDAFKHFIKQQNFNTEQLNLLGTLLFESIYPFNETPEILQQARKAVYVLNTLELEYQQLSLDNLHRREQLDKFLSNLQYE